MGWAKIEQAELVKGEMINFIELNKAEWVLPATQTIHIGWLENEDEFYSESSNQFIKRSKITYINKIPDVPNCL